jgi:hypothetical protein
LPEVKKTFYFRLFSLSYFQYITINMKKHSKDQNSIQDAERFSRRHFVKMAGITALGVSSFGLSDFYTKGVSIISDPEDLIAGCAPVRWATKELEDRLTSRGINVSRYKSLSQANTGDFCIVVSGLDSSITRRLLKTGKTSIPALPEALGLVPVNSSGKQVLLTCGYDQRGLIYALLELTDRVENSTKPLDSLNITKPVVEVPANVIRSLNRLFVSDIEDKPWFHDREMWPKYLTMLATHRFNRFNLSLGIGYDFLQNVTDGYFLFAYPFLLNVPGYNVRVPQLQDSEREKNLEMIRFISSQTVARGLQFQLGIWMHGYEWINSPDANYTIVGLTPETHGPYCRDAVRELLIECPDISGITFRIHGESGVTEGSYDFWKTIFSGVATCGRKVEIDMHAKGMDQTMIDSALASGMPVNISPKYWAEHLGMPYHQADIRALEIPKADRKSSGLMNLSAGSRSFTRYGYGDLLKDNRKYGVLHRIWPGTQRLLLWGDPKISAAHSRAFSFCGSVGAELMEPLSFKGRRGSGIAGGRCGYSDKTLKPRWDWEKYDYSLRIFGRLAYNPDSEPDVWRRYLLKQFGPGAESVELALANATRILPIVLTVHGASAGNNTYWPEVYTNQSIPDPKNKNPYNDSPSPRVFGNVSPMDPQLFLRINDFATELIKNERSGKYTPIEAAQWLEDYADVAAKYLSLAESNSTGKERPQFRRMSIDIAIVIGLGRFFASKFRAGVLFGIFEQSGDYNALIESLNFYKKARAHWAELANRARDVYKPDITIGENPFLRGHWLDRLPAIDEDIAYMTGMVEQLKSNVTSLLGNVQSAIIESKGRPVRSSGVCYHNRPQGFRAGQPLTIEISFDKTPVSAHLYYRHVNHAERYETEEMHLDGSGYLATIPSTYTDSQYPIQYYIELRDGPGKAWLYPGFMEDLVNQPYFVVHRI